MTGMRGTVLRQWLYGVLSVVGLIGTWYFNISFAGPGNYVAAWFANDASSSAATDLIVVSLAASIFMVVEGRRLGMRRAWLYVVAGFVLAMAFAVPLFLLMRERALGADRVTLHRS